MKKIILSLTVLTLLIFSSCARRYTCPTYLKNNDENKNVRVENTLPDEEKATISSRN